MANLILTTVFLLVLISSYGIISTEERLLKITAERNIKLREFVRAYKSSSTPTVMSDMINFRRNALEDGEFHEPSSGGGVSHFNGKTDQNTDDFRPTEPGHSPGAGHSNGPRSEGPN